MFFIGCPKFFLPKVQKDFAKNPDVFQLHSDEILLMLGKVFLLKNRTNLPRARQIFAKNLEKSKPKSTICLLEVRGLFCESPIEFQQNFDKL